MSPRATQILLIAATLLTCWLGMQAIHEAGHLLGAAISGATVTHVSLHPLSFSRTDVADNPQPLLVVRMGPIFGTALPVLICVIAAACRATFAYLLRIFSGACAVLNGAYIAIGSLDRVGDCGVMLRHGSPAWSLWLFGAICIPLGIFLWHGQAGNFGLGVNAKPVAIQHALLMTGLAMLLIVLGFAVGR